MTIQTEIHPRPSRRRVGIFIAVGLLFALACYVIFQGAPLDSARRAVKDGRIKDARAAFLEHLEQKPDDTSARLELAILLERHTPDLAAEHFAQIPESAPEYPLALRHLADINLNSGNDQRAELLLRRLQEVTPNDSDVVRALADLYFRSRAYKQALAGFRRYIELSPQDAQAYLLLAETLDELNRPADMTEPLQTALRIDPNLYAAHANLAYSLRISGQPDAAEEHARWCLKQRPDDARVIRQLASILRDQGQPEEALRLVRQALRIVPDDVPCHSLEADLLMFLQRPEEAYQSLQSVYQLASGQRAYLALLTRAAGLSGRRDEARQLQSRINELIDAADDRVRE